MEMDQNPLQKDTKSSKMTKSIEKFIDFVIIDHLLDILIKNGSKSINMDQTQPYFTENQTDSIKNEKNLVDLIKIGSKSIKNEHRPLTRIQFLLSDFNRTDFVAQNWNCNLISTSQFDFEALIP